MSSLDGPAMTVQVTSSNGATRSWSLPQALLSHHSGYFMRAAHFREGTQMVKLTNYEPRIFEMFVQFVYYGTYVDRDDLKDDTRVRDSAKAWVLGDYLDVPGLKQAAIDSLFKVHIPIKLTKTAQSSFGPEAVRYCCENSAPSSSLYEFYLGAAAAYWRHKNIVRYNDANQKDWDAIWDNFPDFRNKLLRLMTRLPEEKVEENTTLDLRKRMANMDRTEA